MLTNEAYALPDHVEFERTWLFKKIISPFLIFLVNDKRNYPNVLKDIFTNDVGS